MSVDETKRAIQSAYKAFLNKKGLNARQSQKQMIADITNYLFSIKSDSEGNRSSPARLCVIEAGTGTGKTLAYLTAGIPSAQSLGKTLVLSTATITLQEQLVNKDLPDFHKSSGISFTYTLAKGRGRYLCVSRLEQLMANSDHNGDLFGGSTDLAAQSADSKEKLPPETLQALFDDYAAMRWNGEYDHMKDQIPMTDWYQLTADNRSCTSRACSHFHHCPYYDARNKWDSVDVLVCNHDLVLADLALGGGVILPKTEDCIFVFDEAHHVADKALNHFSQNAALQGSRQWLKQMMKSLSELLPHLSSSSGYQKLIDEMSTFSQEADMLLGQFYEHCLSQLDWSKQGFKGDRKDNQEIYRFANGEVDEALRATSQDLQLHFSAMTRNAEKLFADVKKGLSEDNAGSEAGLSKEESEQWYPVLGLILNRCENHSQLWKLFSSVSEGNTRPLAKWLKKLEFNDFVDVSVACSPLVADNILTEGLWKRAFGIVLTSATLTSGESFESFRFKNGIPEKSDFKMLLSPFNYAENAVLHIPENFPDPSRQEDHTESIVKFVTKQINTALSEKAAKSDVLSSGAHGAILVLFSSRQQMNDVFFGLERGLRNYITRQDDMSKAEAVALHKEKVKENISLLFGLASFAEGLDLPGKFLTHVIIAKIPFAVPDDPLDAALSEWVENRGGNPFMEISLPAAAVRLKQACGRLIRNEKDTGRVSLLDSRVLSRRYGGYFLKSLPAYRIEYDAIEMDT